MAHVPHTEMKQFWDAEVYPILAHLIANTHTLKTIQARFNWLMTTIVNRYRTNLNVCLSDKKSGDRRAGFKKPLPMGCGLINNQPELRIFMPDLRLVFLAIRNKNFSGFRQIFETWFLVAYLHELDHLALGIKGGPKNIADLIRGEAITWAETCEFTIMPLAEIYRRELCFSDALYYSKWVQSGRNVESPQWKKFIADLYMPLSRG